MAYGNQKNKKEDIKGLKKGQALKLFFYKREITANGKIKNKFTYTDYHTDDKGERVIDRYYFIVFWGDYDLDSTKSVIIDEILGFDFFYYKDKSGKWMTNLNVVIKIKEEMVNNTDNKNAQKVEQANNYQANDDDYYYGNDAIDF